MLHSARWLVLVVVVRIAAVVLERLEFCEHRVRVDLFVGGVGIGALLLAVEQLLDRRAPARPQAACPQCGHVLLEGA